MHAAVLGHPIEHSLSPVLHGAAYTALGLEDWSYGKHDVDEGELATFVAGLGADWAGLSLTMPLKKAIFPLLAHVEPLAEVTGSVNTVLFSGKGAGRMSVGTNTDVYGLVQALKEGLGDRYVQGAKTTGVVIGAGATAASTLAALAELGCARPTVFVRNLGRTAELRAAAGRMGVDPQFMTLAGAAAAVVTADLVVSTLPANAADGLAQELLGAAATPRGVLLDVAYAPTPTTALISAWRELGGAAVTGERMLLHQAAEQVRLMTGKTAPVEAMARALEAAIAPK